MALMSFTRYMCVFFVLELIRRLLQSWRNAFGDLRLVAVSAAAFIVLLLDQLFVKENTYSFPVLSMVFTAYVAFMSSPWGLVRQVSNNIKHEMKRLLSKSMFADFSTEDGHRCRGARHRPRPR